VINAPINNEFAKIAESNFIETTNKIGTHKREIITR
jgi:hypothetical protein